MAKAISSALAGAATRRDWTKGSLFRNLLFLAWPVIVSSCLNTMGTTIDMIWVGRLGATSVAGVGVAGMLVAILDAFKMGLDMGTRAMIARFVGAGDMNGANRVALQGYVVTIAFAATVGTVGFILSGSILRFVGLAPDVVAESTPYLRIQFIGILTMGLVRQNEGTMQSSGDTVTPMRVAIIYRLFHVALCPFLVFGWWVFPRLGVSGAAYTGITSACLGAGIGLWLLISGRTRLTLKFRGFKPDFKLIWRVIRIGVPSSISGIERSFGQLIMTTFVVPFGTLAVAAHTLTQQVDGFINIGGSGIGQASGILAGQNLGARRPDRAEKSGWLGVTLYTSLMAVGSVVLWFWGSDVIRVFNRDAELVAIGTIFLRIQIVTYMVLGCSNVLQHCLNGMGDTLPAMIVVLVSMFGIQVPLAYLLSQHTSLGVYGTRWAIAIGTVAMAIIYVVYFRLGRWKHRTV